jgi:histidyl-tRNA synthetase
VTICGGGRYDGLIEAIGGPPTPGIGFGAGLERLELALGDWKPAQEGIDVFFVMEDGAPRDRVLKTIAELRARGVTADTDYAGRSVKGQFTQAGRLGARTVVVVGADGARVRSEGHEEAVSLDDLPARLVS